MKYEAFMPEMILTELEDIVGQENVSIEIGRAHV